MKGFDSLGGVGIGTACSNGCQVKRVSAQTLGGRSELSDRPRRSKALEPMPKPISSAARDNTTMARRGQGATATPVNSSAPR